MLLIVLFTNLCRKNFTFCFYFFFIFLPFPLNQTVSEKKKNDTTVKGPPFITKMMKK